MKKKLFCLILVIVLIYSVFTLLPAYAATIYAPDGRSAIVGDSEVSAYEAVGWYCYPVVSMYAYDGRCIVVSEASVSEWEAVGWIDGRKTITVYSLDGREAKIPQWQMYSYEAVGWYSCPLVMVFMRSYRYSWWEGTFITNIKEAKEYNSYSCDIYPITINSLPEYNINWKIFSGDFSDYEGSWTNGYGQTLYIDSTGRYPGDDEEVADIRKNADDSYSWSVGYDYANILYPVGAEIIAYDGKIVKTDTSRPRLWQGNGSVTHDAAYIYYYMGK